MNLIAAMRENVELVITLVMVFVVMITYYFYLFREYNKTKQSFQMKRYTSICPDYWTLSENSNPNDTNPTIICNNPKKIGRCFESKDFSTDLYKEDIAKCKWSKYCNAPWEGVDNLCADLTLKQLTN